jgi:serine/threonine protein kinase
MLITSNLHNQLLQLRYTDNRGFGADDESLPWKIRMRIAKELANALTYLHTALSSPVVHSDIRPGSIFLDNNLVPKFSNFSISITIPPKQLPVVDDGVLKREVWIP